MDIYGIYIYILVGGDWNHGTDYEFPETVVNGIIIIPTDFHSIIFQSGGEKPPTRYSDFSPSFNSPENRGSA